MPMQPSEPRKAKDAHRLNLLARVLLAKGPERFTVLQREELHRATYAQVADLRAIVITLADLLDTWVDSHGDRAAFESQLLALITGEGPNASTK